MSIIFKYIKKADNSLIGYHLDTFCQCGAKEGAKQYGCETAEEIKSQTAIIDKNFTSMFNIKDDADGLFDAGRRQIRDELYTGLKREDIVIGWEEVPTVATEPMVHTIISNGLTQPTNKPLGQVLKETIANIIAKKN